MFDWGVGGAGFWEEVADSEGLRVGRTEDGCV